MEQLEPRYLLSLPWMDQGLEPVHDGQRIALPDGQVTGVLDEAWFTPVPVLGGPNAEGWILAGWGPSPDELSLNTTCNVNAADTTNSDQLWAGGGLWLNLNGAGYTVGVWDEGWIRSTHQEFTTPTGSRVTIRDTGASANDHSTHVGGTIGATGVQAAAHGMANQVNLWSYDWNSDYAEMASAASTIVVSNHSYAKQCGWMAVWANGPNGPGNYGRWLGDRFTSDEDAKFGKYRSDAQSIDSTLYNNPNLLSVWAAGNERNENLAGLNTWYQVGLSDGTWRYYQVNDLVYPAPPADGSHDGGFDSLNHDHTAKNTLVVGAVADVTADPYNAAQVATLNFSNWGPTDDGRIKPDVVANGDGLFSPVAFVPGTNPPTASNSSYDTYPGTSMAAPNVTGTAVQLIEHYEDLFGARPRSATTKGIIIHTAFDAGRTGPDYEFGWGLVDAARAANFITGASDQGSRDRIVEGTYSGSEYTQEVVSDGVRPLKATIVWTDPPGTVADNVLDSSAAVLVNDLDLWVTGPGGTFRPWTLDRTNPASPAVRTTANHLDNVEQVLIDAPAAGTYTVHVGRTGNTFTQAFSLLVSGGVRPSDFGDAPPYTPAGYPTQLSQNGARHFLGSGLWLGANPPDAEGDGLPDVGALGDDNSGVDDEDGVTIPALRAGQDAIIQGFVTDVLMGTQSYLSAWVDWNQNLRWDDPGEQVYSGPVAPNQGWAFPVSVPQDASHGYTYARFRLSRDPGLPFYGLSTTGEVEDYRVFVQGWGPDLSGFDCSNQSPTLDWGQTLTVRGRVKNQGTEPVTADFQQQFFIAPDLVWGDGDEVYRAQYLHTADVPANDVGPLFEVTLTLPSQTPPGFSGTGPFYIGMTTDAYNNVAESDEANNFPGSMGNLYDFCAFHVPAYYDLRAWDCRVPATIGWGETFTLEGRVRNDGTLPVTADFEQQFFLGADEIWGNGEERSLGDFVHVQDIPANSVGSWFDVTLTLPDPAFLPPVFSGPGPFYIGMTTDARNHVAERNEADNLPGSYGWLSDYDSFSLHNNDDFAYRIDLGSAASVTDTGNNMWYTGEPGEPVVELRIEPITSAWWSWTAPSDGTLTIDTFGSGFDTYLSLWTGNAVDNLTLVDANDDYGEVSQSRIACSVTPGVQYQIAVDGWADETGAITLNLSFAPVAPNLTPYQPAGWPDEIVVSNQPGTHADDSPLFGSVYVDWSVINSGGAVAPAPFWNRVYVDGSVRFEDRVDVSLPPGAQVTREDLGISGLTPGQHTIRIVTDAFGSISESNETDNEYAKTIFISVPSLPNLTPHQPAGWSDKIVVSNQPGTNTDDSPLSETVYVDWSVINNGAAAVAQGPFWNRIYVDGSVRFEDRVDELLQPGAFVTRQDMALGLTPGQHTIKIVSDIFGAVTESSETDNEYTKTVFISAPSLPNLTPYQPAGWSDKIVVSNRPGTHTDDPLLQTDTLYVDWAIVNNGTVGTAATYRVDLYRDNVLRGSWEPADLGPGASWSLDDFALGGGLSPGQHTVRIVVDSTGAISESNENDNEYTKTIFVTGQALPNLTPYQPAGWADKIVVSRQPGTHTDDSPLFATEPFYVDWSVINNGGAVAPAPFWTRIYVDDVVRFEDRVDTPLPPGAYLSREDAAFGIGGLTPGQHTIRIVTDAFDAISESNETDNEYTKTVFFSAATLPNLTPYQPAGWSDKIVVSNQPGTHTEDVVLAGSPFYVDFGLINDGPASTGTGFGLMLYLDGLPFGGGSQSALNAGAWRALEDIALGPLAAGPHFLRIVLDSSDEVLEGDETDNEYQRMFMVVEPTSITVVEDAVPDHPQDFSFFGPLVEGFLLDDDDDPTLPRMRVFDGLDANSYTVLQEVVADWELADIVVAGDLDNGSLVDLANRMAILDLDAGENLTVTFVNRLVHAPVRVWSGASVLSTMDWNDLWTNPFNWEGDVAPLPGDRLEFPEAAFQKSLHNDFSGESFGGITFSGGGYSIAPLVPGTVTGLSGGIVNASTASDDNMLSFDIRLDAPEAVSNDRLDQKLVLTGSLDTNGYPLVVGGEGPIDLGSSASAMIGTGMLFKNGAGTTTLRGNNRYAGGTIVNQGTLVVAAAGALPSGGSLMIGTEDSEGAGAAVVLAIGLNGVAASAAPDIAAVASRSSDQRATPPHSTLAPAMPPVPVAFLPAPRAASIAVPGPLASEPMSAAHGSTVCREVPVPVLSGPLSASIPSTPRSDSILRQTQDRALQSCIAKPWAAKAWIALVEPLGPRKHARERAARTLLTVDEVLARFGQ